MPRETLGTLRVKEGILLEHWDVIPDEAAEEQSKRKAPMFGGSRFALRSLAFRRQEEVGRRKHPFNW